MDPAVCTCLDPRHVYVIQSPTTVYVWEGKLSTHYHQTRMPFLARDTWLAAGGTMKEVEQAVIPDSHGFDLTVLPTEDDIKECLDKAVLTPALTHAALAVGTVRHDTEVLIARAQALKGGKKARAAQLELEKNAVAVDNSGVPESIYGGTREFIPTPFAAGLTLASWVVDREGEVLKTKILKQGKEPVSLWKVMQGKRKTGMTEWQDTTDTKLLQYITRCAQFTDTSQEEQDVVAVSPNESDVLQLKYPSCEALPLFDSDDLLPDQTFILVTDGPVYHVWVGEDWAGDEIWSAFAPEAVLGLCESQGLEPGLVEVIFGSEEPDSFWEFFVNG